MYQNKSEVGKLPLCYFASKFPPTEYIKRRREQDNGGGGDLLTKLQQLDQCHRDGLLSDSEFASAKQAALSCFTGVGVADAAEAVIQVRPSTPPVYMYM